ncbi:MAG: VTT domain-containing protein [Geminicoccaceae bacterium]|nr:VTT domain-containing protein [Geminicoccaceae bacterium]MCS7267815.1 VTT domain-containing protein [Geminicoccaceae bacterium]MCX7630714.1 VTT domain-containing protein [Geminicoccaceae bacterium]MDW8123646.1 VTT domain-containing protein [Geminicoccaceae bacterium]MDW8342776.1 VTT domain-containing protein [Geminicoccaceae bacterium]
MRRLLLAFLLLAGLVLVPFLIWGEALETALAAPELARVLEARGPLAGAMAVGLLWSDLLLPVPATAVMSALGFVYGIPWGTILGAAGSMLAGLTGYGLCRALGRDAAERILGRDGLAQGERLFARIGVWLVLLSRWLPVFPEVVACMAGLARMPFSLFVFALAAGSVPMAAAFAAVGRFGVERPDLALLVSAVAPPLIWLVLRPLALRAGRASAEPAPRERAQ